MTPRACPGCGDSRDLPFVEEVRDPVAGTAFRLHRCGTCGLIFAEARDLPNEAWYARAGTAPAPRDFAPRPAGRALRLDWRGADALKGLAAKDYDAIVLDGTLEHSSEPRELLGRVKPVLKRGGFLYISALNEARPRFLGREPEDAPPRRFTRWNASALTALMRGEGFVVIETSAPGPSMSWLSDRLFDAAVAPAWEAMARRVLFGPDSRGTLAALYAAGSAAGSAAPPDGLKVFFADARRRAAWAGAFRTACAPFLWLVAAPLRVFFAVARGRGERLVAVARLDA
jgi:SAM-dependent methyltransferase